MPDPKPQGPDIAADLRTAMQKAGYTQRSLSKELQQRRPRAGGAESWRNTLGKYLTANAEKRQVPDAETAELLSAILKKPKGFFVRRRGGGPLWERIHRLQEENQRLREQLARRRRAGN